MQRSETAGYVSIRVQARYSCPAKLACRARMYSIDQPLPILCLFEQICDEVEAFGSFIESGVATFTNLLLSALAEGLEAHP